MTFAVTLLICKNGFHISYRILHQSYWNSCGNSLNETPRIILTFHPISGNPGYHCEPLWGLCNFMAGLHTHLSGSCFLHFYDILRTCHTPECEYCKDSSLSLIYCTNSFQTQYDVLQRAVTGSGSQAIGRLPSLILFHF